MDTKYSPINLAMLQVLQKAEPKSVSRRVAAESMSITEAQLHRLLGGNPASIRDISITVLQELAEVWGKSLIDLVKEAEALAPTLEPRSAELLRAVSEARSKNVGSEDDFEFDPNVNPEDLGLAANEGERKIDQGNTDDSYGTSDDSHGTQDNDSRSARGSKR